MKILAVHQLSLCMHAHANWLADGSFCVCLVVTEQDLKFELNLFMDSGDIGCAH